MVTEVYSKGLYSTYLYIKSLNCAFDCGEGLSTRLGPRCFGIQKLFISHGHIDHIAGIAPLIGIRSAGFGDKSMPLDIYYPKGCKSTESLISYIKTLRAPSYPLTWNPIEPRDEIDLGNKRRVRAFKTEHRGTSLGFSIIEKRDKLIEKYKNLSGKELQKMRMGGTQIVQRLDHILWAYSGDAYKIPQNEIKEADWLFCDTTFLKTEDREENTHMSLEEAIELAKQTKVKNLVGMHLSPRYNQKDIKDAQKLLKNNFPNSTLVIPNRLEKIEDSTIKKSKEEQYIN